MPTTKKNQKTTTAKVKKSASSKKAIAKVVKRKVSVKKETKAIQTTKSTKSKVASTRKIWRPTKVSKKVTVKISSPKTINKKSTAKKKSVVKTKVIVPKDIRSKNKTFKEHKVWKRNKEWLNFAFILLVASILLFVFSLYKAFWETDSVNFDDAAFVEQERSFISVQSQDDAEEILVKNEEDPIVFEIESYQEVTKDSPQFVVEGVESESIVLVDDTSEVVEEVVSVEEVAEDIVEATILDVENVVAFEFYRSYEKDQDDKEIGVLQDLLKKEWFYQWEINNIYDRATMNSVFAMQLQYGILKEDASMSVRGFFGPGTRYRANQLLKKY